MQKTSLQFTTCGRKQDERRNEVKYCKFITHKSIHRIFWCWDIFVSVESGPLWGDGMTGIYMHRYVVKSSCRSGVTLRTVTATTCCNFYLASMNRSLQRIIDVSWRRRAKTVEWMLVYFAEMVTCVDKVLQTIPAVVLSSGAVARARKRSPFIGNGGERLDCAVSSTEPDE